MKRTLVIALILAGYFALTNSSFAQLSSTYTVVNKSGVTVKAVYFTPTGANAWSDNISTVDKIGLNEGFQYGFDGIDKDHCTIDLKFVDTDGKDWMMNNVSLCSASVITLRKLK